MAQAIAMSGPTRSTVRAKPFRQFGLLCLRPLASQPHSLLLAAAGARRHASSLLVGPPSRRARLRPWPFLYAAARMNSTPGSTPPRLHAAPLAYLLAAASSSPPSPTLRPVPANCRGLRLCLPVRLLLTRLNSAAAPLSQMTRDLIHRSQN